MSCTSKTKNIRRVNKKSSAGKLLFNVSCKVANSFHILPRLMYVPVFVNDHSICAEVTF